MGAIRFSIRSRAALLLLAGLLLCPLSRAQELLFLVGSYTRTEAEGVSLYAFDPATAGTRLLATAPSGNPSFVIPSPDGTMAYAVNEYHDGRQGVSSFSVGADTLALLQYLPIPEDAGGEDPCNILCTGDALVTSNYTGGTVTAFSLDGDGRIEGLSQQFSAGKTVTAGIWNPSQWEEKAHMHCAVLSPEGRYIFVTNLGNDCIHRFDRGTDGAPLKNAQIAWSHHGVRKFGPRHMVFSADGRFAYLLCELGDKLVVFSYDDGTLTPIQTLTAYKGKGHGSADIHLSPDGRFLYTSHRLRRDGIAIFSVNPRNGKVKAAGYQPTGTHPRNFALSPDGRFLLCACRDDNRIEIYRVAPDSGLLTRTDQTIETGAPVCIQWL